MLPRLSPAGCPDLAELSTDSPEPSSSEDDHHMPRCSMGHAGASAPTLSERKKEGAEQEEQQEEEKQERQKFVEAVGSLSSESAKLPCFRCASLHEPHRAHSYTISLSESLSLSLSLSLRESLSPRISLSLTYTHARHWM